MRRFWTFVAVCFTLSWGAALIFHLLGGQYQSIVGSLFASAYMFIPMVSVIVTQALFKEHIFSEIGLSVKINRWWFVGWFLLAIFAIAALFASLAIPGTALEPKASLFETLQKQSAFLTPVNYFWISILSGLLAGATINALFAFGEECAWRGFLPRALGEMGFWKKALLIGAIWGVWHAPLILMGHNYPHHPWGGVGMMVAFCAALSPLLLWLRQMSGSVLVPAIAHGTLNALAGLSLVYLAGFDEMLCGCCGAVGIAIMVVADLILAAAWKKPGIV